MRWLTFENVERSRSKSCWKNGDETSSQKHVFKTIFLFHLYSIHIWEIVKGLPCSYSTVRDSMEDDLRTRARHIAFLVCLNNPLVLTGGVKFGQSEGIPDSGILERLPLRKFHRRSLVAFPSLPSFFPALSFAFFFARAPLSERLEQAKNFSCTSRIGAEFIFLCVSEQKFERNKRF